MGSRELYVVLDKPVYGPGEIAQVRVLTQGGEPESLSLSVVDYKGVVASVNLEVKTSEALEQGFQLQVPRIPGRYELLLRLGDVVLDKVAYLVVEEGELHVDRYLAFVWHNHQAPGYLPDGSYYFHWAFKHVYENELLPYSKGPYYYHAVMLDKYPKSKCTYNLSPSLLAQWVEVLERGVTYRERRIEPESPEARVVKETLDRYRAAATRGQIDVLTSMYAHSIAGFLVEHLGAEDIVREEVEYGAEITRRVIGVEPRGVWTPEMAFTMKLVDVYSDLGLEYTVLDAKCHYEKSTGDRGSILEPYRVKGTKGELVVFFRDTELSNYVSFKNNFKSELHAWKSAYEFTYLIAEKLKLGGILTIALDGENWMIFSRKPPLTAVFYDKLLGYLTEMQREGYLSTVTLRELVEKYPPRRVLSYVPTTSWLCGFSKWCGEVKDHEEYWARVKRVYEELRNYEAVNGRDEKSRRARWALWHALDSDYWWAEFWEPEYIDAWIRKAEEELSLRTENRFL